MSMLPTYKCKECNHTFSAINRNGVCHKCGSKKITEEAFGMSMLKKGKE